MKYEELASKLAGKEVPQEVLDLVGIKEERVGRFKPKLHDKYYTVYDEGDIVQARNTSHKLDKCRINMGNCYETREEAELARDRKLALVECLDEIARLNDGWLPDWQNHYENKYPPTYLHTADMLRTDVVTYAQHLETTHYLKSRKLCDQFINTHGDKYKFAMGWE